MRSPLAGMQREPESSPSPRRAPTARGVSPTGAASRSSTSCSRSSRGGRRSAARPRRPREPRPRARLVGVGAGRNRGAARGADRGARERRVPPPERKRARRGHLSGPPGRDAGRRHTRARARDRCAPRHDRRTSRRERHLRRSTPRNTVQYELCGLGKNCSITEGKPTTRAAQLLRREALELALYSFRYFDGIDSTLVLLPPRADGNEATASSSTKNDVRARAGPTARSDPHRTAHARRRRDRR